MRSYNILLAIVLSATVLPGCHGNLPKTYKDYLLQADTVAGNGDFRRAIPLYTEAILTAPDSASEAYKLRALCRYNLHQFDSAQLDVSHAITLNPKDVQSRMLRARLYEVSAKFPDAIEDYSAVLQMYPHDTLALNNRGSVYSRMDEPGMALADFNQLIKADSNYWPAYNNSNEHCSLASGLLQRCTWRGSR